MRQREGHFYVDFSLHKMKHKSGKWDRDTVSWKEDTQKTVSTCTPLTSLERKDVAGGTHPHAVPRLKVGICLLNDK